MKFYETFIAGRMIFDCTIAVIVDPKLADDYVMNGGCDFFVRIMLARVFKDYMRIAG